jgi:hypothetical protein
MNVLCEKTVFFSQNARKDNRFCFLIKYFIKKSDGKALQLRGVLKKISI